jgi:hypothetical protein
VVAPAAGPGQGAADRDRHRLGGESGQQGLAAERGLDADGYRGGGRDDREPGYRGVDACQRVVGFEEEVPLIRIRASPPSATST